MFFYCFTEMLLCCLYECKCVYFNAFSMSFQKECRCHAEKAEKTRAGGRSMKYTLVHFTHISIKLSFIYTYIIYKYIYNLTY